MLLNLATQGRGSSQDRTKMGCFSSIFCILHLSPAPLLHHQILQISHKDYRLDTVLGWRFFFEGGGLNLGNPRKTGMQWWAQIQIRICKYSIQYRFLSNCIWIVFPVSKSNCIWTVFTSIRVLDLRLSVFGFESI